MSKNTLPPAGDGQADGSPAALANGQRNGRVRSLGAERLRALAGLLWGGKWIILGVFVAVVGAAAWYTYSIAPIYRTSSLLLVKQENGRQTSFLSDRGSGGLAAGYGGSRNLSNELLLLNQSRTIARRVAQRLDSMETHPRTGERLDILYTPTGARRPVRSVAGSVQGSMSARTAGREVDAIRISVSGTEPAETALIANLYAQEYITRTQERSRQSLRAKRRFLDQQARRFRREVEEAEKKLESYMQANGAVSLNQESGRIVEQLSQLEARRNELQIELDMKRAALESKREELKRVRPKLAERLSSGLDEKLSRVQEEKAEVDLRLDQIQRRNPSLAASGTGKKAKQLARLQRRSEELAERADSLAQRQVEKTLAAGGVGGGSEEGGRGLTFVVEKQREIAQQRIEVSGLEAQLQTVRRRIEEQRERLKELPEQSLKLAQLQRERRSAEEMYGYLREQMQQTQMAMESEIGYAEVIQPAGIPRGPVSPDKQRNLILAAMLGLLLGGGLVYLREQLDTYLRVPEDVNALGHSVVGVIPSMEELLEEQFGGAETVELDGTEVNAALVMLTSSMSSVAESYRRLRANLRFARPDADLQSLAVTSPGQGEGKTTTATNLALATASAGQTTLLVDADLRHPRVHSFLGRAQSPGLTEALYRPSLDLDDYATSIDDLYVMAAGEEVPNPSEQLGSERMRRLVARLEEIVDTVIVDTPPVLLFSDPLAVAPYVDGSLLVARAHETDGRALAHAAELLGDVGATPVGVVLNRYVAATQSPYGYSYQYRYTSYRYRYGFRALESYYEEGTNGRPSGVAGTVRSWFR